MFRAYALDPATGEWMKSRLEYQRIYNTVDPTLVQKYG
jgi:hypothetical protein